MKKLLLLAVAAAAISFVGCKKVKEAADKAADDVKQKVEETVSNATESQEAKDMKADLQASLEKKEGQGLKDKIMGVKDKVVNWVKEGKLLEATSVVSTVQGFLKDNKDKINEVVGDNAFVSGALETIGGLDVKDLANQATEAVGGKVEAKAEEKAAEK